MPLVSSPTETATEATGTLVGRHIADLIRQVQDYGIHLEYRTDFDHFREVVAEIPEKKLITPVFDPRVSDIGADNGIWIKGMDKDNKVVHVQAVRFDDMTGSNLNLFWQANRDLYRPIGMDVDVRRSDFTTAPVSHEISGPVCYHAEFWIDKSSRKMGLLPRLSMLALSLALAQFSPNYIYGFATPRLIKKGLSIQYGYHHFHPWGPRWHIIGEDKPYDEYLMWITGEELVESWATSERKPGVLHRHYHGNDGRAAVM